MAPGLTHSFFTNLGEPTAATKISACRQISGRFRVLEWAITTVQFSFSNKRARGFPTKIDRPKMTAYNPFKFFCY